MINFLRTLLDTKREDNRQIISGLEVAKDELRETFRNVIKEELRLMYDKVEVLEGQINKLTDGSLSLPMTTCTLARSKGLRGKEQVNDEIDSRFEYINNNISFLMEGIKNIEETVIPTGVAAIIAEVRLVEDTLVGKLIYDKESLTSEVRSCEGTITQLTKKEFTDIHNFLKDTDQGLSYLVTDQVCRNIVGESYARWDSLCSYYPTIVFVFNEVDVGNNPRRSQIKLRLNQTSADITDQDVRFIRHKVQNLKNMHYYYGTCKGNYVSSDKRFKTTVYGQDRQSITSLLTHLFEVITEPFDPGLLSITDIGRKRPSLTKRKTDLDSTGFNVVDYDQTFTLKLKCANLLVNGMKTVIRL